MHVKLPHSLQSKMKLESQLQTTLYNLKLNWIIEKLINFILNNYEKLVDLFETFILFLNFFPSKLLDTW